MTVRTDGEWDCARATLWAVRRVEPAQWFATQDAATVADRLAEAGIPAAVVISPSLVIENPQLVAPRLLRTLTHPSTGRGLYPCPPFARPDGMDRWLHRPPPTLGQHNTEVFTELCGLTEADLERLAGEGVIGTRPKGL